MRSAAGTVCDPPLTGTVCDPPLTRSVQAVLTIHERSDSERDNARAKS